jgi:transcriptional regulator with XRE-family HTH domain
MSGMTVSQQRPPGWIPDLSTFGARLALLRQTMGWTNVKEAAVACAIPVETWRRWENGKFEPRGLVNAAMKISGVTGVDYRWLALGPVDRQASLPGASTDTVAVTAKYLPGERVVTTGMDARRIDAHLNDLVNVPLMRGSMRTRPIDSTHPGSVGVR